MRFISSTTMRPILIIANDVNGSHFIKGVCLEYERDASIDITSCRTIWCNERVRVDAAGTIPRDILLWIVIENILNRKINMQAIRHFIGDRCIDITLW